MIERAVQTDIEYLVELAVKLWPGSSRNELESDFDGFISSADNAMFLARADDLVLGFAHCSLRRDYVAGAESSPAGYLEGIYVDEAERYKGHARKLVEACEQWARDKGCSDFASDCLHDNSASIEMHQHLGFDEVERTISFHKKL
ncbi:aminoglycoside 6'-N-acetyltransferase [Salinicoccus hispanicus]|uniref:Aminoglycoside N(6')-acetyltransferase type 1 n=1 Tax=Salinicoccus hispanicus TaxID=157225 RepID=A0A6N8TZP1_9STAP|nr:aminoglycoside 6'-N-acetyltransferase [Salinicoccus hispanicus]MXQ50156.1 GNAT family N-acetyltransferase [Salinicoccus hispanicus]